jgi:antibiotic biosynthesis monooxygenase (ABM) superfamily enzyme
MCNLHTYRYLKIHSGQNIVHKLTKNNNSPWFKPRLKEFSVKGARKMKKIVLISYYPHLLLKKIFFTPYSIKPEPQLYIFDLLKTVYSVHTSAALSIRVGQRQTVYIQQQLSVLEQVSSQRAAASITCRVGQRQTVYIQQQLSV